jgi:hypothetical protein
MNLNNEDVLQSMRAQRFDGRFRQYVVTPGGIYAERKDGSRVYCGSSTQATVEKAMTAPHTFEASQDQDTPVTFTPFLDVDDDEPPSMLGISESYGTLDMVLKDLVYGTEVRYTMFRSCAKRLRDALDAWLEEDEGA